MVKSAVARAALLLFALFLAACNSQPVARTTVDRVLKAPDVPNAPYSNLVLVGVAPSRDLARQLEQGLREVLRDRGVEVHSFVSESTAKEATPEAVKALVDTTGAGGVLMITGRPTGGDIEEHEEIVDVEARSIGGNLVNFFRYDYKEFTEPTYTDVTLDVVLVSLLFDAASNSRVHSVEAHTSDGESSYQIIMAQSKAIAARLAKDGMIR